MALQAYSSAEAFVPADRHPEAAETRIDQVTDLGRERFHRAYFRPKKPVVMRHFARDWPALAKWNFDFFARQTLNDPVTIERGNVLQGPTDFFNTEFADFVARLIAGTVTPGQGYLSMFRIFDHFPHLRQDTDFSYLTDVALWDYTFGWLGPAGTLTGYHIDWIDNILVQVMGRKRLWLVPPGNHAAMYPSRKYDFRSTLSRLEPGDTDLSAYPRFAEIKPIVVTLEPGDGLFLPRGWWHRVCSLDPSISINTFAHDLSGILFYQAPAKMLDILHRMGLLGSDCTCHQRVADGRQAK